MTKELRIKFGEELKIQAFRLYCLENGIRDGVIYEDGVAFHLNEYANFQRDKYPKTINEQIRLTTAILKAQSNKRKNELDRAY